MKKNTQELQNLAKLKQHGCQSCIICHMEESVLGGKHVECRRKSPRWDTGDGNYQAFFPQPEEDDWCGMGFYSGDAED